LGLLCSILGVCCVHLFIYICTYTPSILPPNLTQHPTHNPHLLDLHCKNILVRAASSLKVVDCEKWMSGPAGLDVGQLLANYAWCVPGLCLLGVVCLSQLSLNETDVAVSVGLLCFVSVQVAHSSIQYDDQPHSVQTPILPSNQPPHPSPFTPSSSNQVHRRLRRRVRPPRHGGGHAQGRRRRLVRCSVWVRGWAYAGLYD
jgi:hypothetical protein